MSLYYIKVREEGLLHILVWASALLSYDWLGNARRLGKWDEQQVQRPTLFVYMYLKLLNETVLFRDAGGTQKLLLMKIRTIILLLLTLLFTQSVFADGQYAKVVNVKTSLNIRESPDKQSGVVGKVSKGETVEVLSESRGGWTKIQYNGMIGYVKDSYIQQIQMQPVATNESTSWSFLDWCDEYKFYILFVLSFFVFAWTRMPEEDFRITMLKLISYSILLIVGLILVGKEAYLEEDLDCWIENKHWIKHAFNVGMLTFYMYTLINGFICTGDALAKLGTKTPEDYEAASVGFFLWLVPLLVLSVIVSTFTAGIPVAIVIGLAFWKFFKNCKLMWPKLQYPILITVLGLAACIAIAYVFFNLIGNIFLLILYGLLFMGMLKGAPKALSEAVSSSSPSSETNTPATTNEPDPYYDTVIKGAGEFGGDVKGKTGMFGIIHGENGKKYKKDPYGDVHEVD